MFPRLSRRRYRKRPAGQRGRFATLPLSESNSTAEAYLAVLITAVDEAKEHVALVLNDYEMRP
ncbi:MAG: hypothetical protein RMK99_12320 [Anaerolineales bacterium]|nr:hypothetical protein [Anaerolineales bacterium]